MSTQIEREDLKQNPLPMIPVTIHPVQDRVNNCPAEVVLDRVLDIDAELQRIQNAIGPVVQYLQDQRQALMNRAAQEGITQSAGAVLIEKEGKKIRNEIANIEEFKFLYPEAYETIREVQKKDIEEKYKKQNRELEESKIPLTLADKYVGKEKVTEYVGYQPPKITYEIVPRNRSA